MSTVAQISNKKEQLMPVDLQQIILEEIQRTRADLKDHILREDTWHDKVTNRIDQHGEEIALLKTATAVTRTKMGFIAAVVSLAVTAALSWLGHIFGYPRS